MSNSDPLAPVVATVRFCGGWFSNLGSEASSEHRESGAEESRRDPASQAAINGGPLTGITIGPWHPLPVYGCGEVRRSYMP